AADDDQIFINNAGTGENDRLLRRFAAEAFPNIDHAAGSETGYGLTGLRVQRIEETLDAREDAAIFSARPVCEPAIRTTAANTGIESPQQFAGDRIERNHFMGGRQSIENAVHHDGLGLRIAGSVRGVVRPGELQLRNVIAIDLLERRIPD